MREVVAFMGDGSRIVAITYAEGSRTGGLQPWVRMGRPRRRIKASALTFTSFGQWAVSPLLPLFGFVVFRGFDRRVARNFGWVTSLTVVAIVLAGYYFVYLVTPIDLAVHLDSSIDRLVLHLWPSFLLLLGLLCRPSK